MAFVMPLTETGVELLVVLPLPSSPAMLEPQHSILWLERRAQVWMEPALTWVAFVTPVTGTGVELWVVLPLPSSPAMLEPRALDPVVGEKGAGVFVAGADRAGVRDASDRNRGHALSGLAVAELAIGVIAPALDPVVGEEGTGVVAADADRVDVRDASDPNRSRAFELVPSVTEHTVGVAAPALGAVVGEDGAGVAGAGAHLGGVRDAFDQYRRRAAGLLTVAELAVGVIAPALDPVVGEEGAGVGIAGAHLSGVRDSTDRNRSRAVRRLAVAEVAAVIHPSTRRRGWRGGRSCGRSRR